MEIQVIDQIDAIDKSEWQKLHMDFASSDGIYDLLLLNNAVESFINPQFIKIFDNKLTTFCLINEISVSIIDDDTSNTWFSDFLKNFFGKNIINKFINGKYSKLMLIILPRLTFDDTNLIINTLKTNLDEFANSSEFLFIYNSFYNILFPKSYSIAQQPYMLFDFSNTKDYIDFIDKQPRTVRRHIERDKKLLVKNKISVREITAKDFIPSILLLNEQSKFPYPAKSIYLLKDLEELGIVHTFGFFEETILIQYLSILVQDNISFILYMNMDDKSKEWNAIFNVYDLFAEKSLNYNVKYAYVGYECETAKMRRGAVALTKYLTYFTE